MKLFKKILYIVIVFVFSLLLLNTVKAYDELVPLVIDGKTIHHYNSSEAVMIPNTYDEKDTEFRGVWVTTVINLDMPIYTSESQYKGAFLVFVNEMLESNANVMLFQVRPLNDAFYDSDYAPWSRYLMGTEGTAPGFDVMTWMINTCHDNGIEFHAWLNPYRVSRVSVSDKAAYLNTLDKNNFAYKHPELVVIDNNGKLILNPGEQAVKQYIFNVINELMTKYDIDGIHFDDYFYPYGGLSSSADSVAYNDTKTAGETLADWRRENVNDVIRGTKEVVDAYNVTALNKVRFGVSPSGIWASKDAVLGGQNVSTASNSSYLALYADSKKWVEEGWLDYIAPQVYWQFDRDTVPYADIVDWWAQISRGTGVDVYIGHAIYKTASDGFNSQEISNQLRYNLKYPEITGEIMFRAGFLDYAGMQTVEADDWTVTPLNVYETVVSDVNINIDGTLYGNIYIDDVVVNLSSQDDIIYRLDDGDWLNYTTPFSVTGTGAHVLYTKTVDSFGTESAIESINIVIQYLNNDVPEYNISGDMIGDNYLPGTSFTLTSNTNDIYVAINHGNIGEFVLYTDPITLTDTGSYFIRIKTIDDRGAESEETDFSLTIQEECFITPTIFLDGVGNDPYYQSVNVSLSGDTNLLYKVNNGDWLEYSSSINFTEEGQYNVYYKNDDSCGIVNEKTIIIDKTSPNNADVNINGEYDGVKYYTTTTSVTLSTSEENTITSYRLHNGKTWSNWQTYTEPIKLLYTANYTLEYYVIDQALNESETTTLSIRLQIPPNETNLYVVRNGEFVTYYNSTLQIQLPIYTEKTEEIRAVWVATVGNIDIGICTSEAQYKQDIITMLDIIEENNFNVIFFQVRPMNDAFYESSYAPWSRYLTGTEGQNPGWDVLQFLIDESHKRGIEFHAWLNPYRVSTGTGSKDSQLSLLDEDNFARQHPELVIADNSGKLILNPGERQVQAYIFNVVRELISKYNVDGIHFDDYFYSYNGTPLSADSDAYNKTKEPGQSVDDWRRENINIIVQEIHDMIKQYNVDNDSNIKFGISPFGIWLSGGEDGSNTSPYALQSYKDQYADSKKWVEEGWVDYILPQLYWEFDHSSAPFADLVDWWANLCEKNDVYLIIGHGFYRYVDGSWDNSNELLEQIRYISQYNSVIGSSFFSYRTLLSNDKEVVEALDRLNNYYWTKYVTFPWESNVKKEDKTTCEIGETYVDGECVLTCDIGETYVNGECVSTCDIGETYVDGECVLTCDIGETYTNGECVSICNIDQTYTDGKCIDNEVNTCQDGYERINNGCRLIPVENNNVTTKIVVIAASSVTVLAGGLLLIFKKSIFKI